MKNKLLLSALIMLANGCQHEFPMKTTVSIEGTWQENFEQIYQSIFNDPPFLVIPPDTVSYSSTLRFEDGRYQVILAPPMETGMFVSGRGQRANWEGYYTINVDTISFMHQAGGGLEQRYLFTLWTDSLRLRIAPQITVSPSGDSIGVYPLGGLPWGYAWMKLAGTFHRIEVEEPE